VDTVVAGVDTVAVVIAAEAGAVMAGVGGAAEGAAVGSVTGAVFTGFGASDSGFVFLETVFFEFGLTTFGFEVGVSTIVDGDM
jgi:hypothetical protein